MSKSRPTIREATTYASHWIIYAVKTDALLAAFPHHKVKRNGASNQASAFHKIKKVQDKIEELQELTRKNLSDELNAKHDLTVSGLKNHLGDIIDLAKAPATMNLGAGVSAIGEVNKMDGNHAPSKIAVDASATLESPLVKKGLREFYAEFGKKTTTDA